MAKTGSASFAWTKVKPLFRSKLENVIVDFSNVSPADEVPPVPNVDVFNFSGKVPGNYFPSPRIDSPGIHGKKKLKFDANSHGKCADYVSAA